jgi:hypothetical protein
MSKKGIITFITFPYITQFNQGAWPPLEDDLATSSSVTGAILEYTCP